MTVNNKINEVWETFGRIGSFVCVKTNTKHVFMGKNQSLEIKLDVNCGIALTREDLKTVLQPLSESRISLITPPTG